MGMPREKEAGEREKMSTLEYWVPTSKRERTMTLEAEDWWELSQNGNHHFVRKNQGEEINEGKEESDGKCHDGARSALVV